MRFICRLDTTAPCHYSTAVECVSLFLLAVGVLHPAEFREVDGAGAAGVHLVDHVLQIHRSCSSTVGVWLRDRTTVPSSLLVMAIEVLDKQAERLRVLPCPGIYIAFSPRTHTWQLIFSLRRTVTAAVSCSNTYGRDVSTHARSHTLVHGPTRTRHLSRPTRHTTGAKHMREALSPLRIWRFVIFSNTGPTVRRRGDHRVTSPAAFFSAG